MKVLPTRLPLRRASAPLALVAAVALATFAHPADARTHVTLGVGFFFPVPLYVAPPVVYYPPPAYYYPPPAYYYPAPPVYVVPRAPAYGYAPPPRRTAKTCRTYRGDATIDATGDAFFGTACLEADGRWHIVAN